VPTALRFKPWMARQKAKSVTAACSSTARSWRACRLLHRSSSFTGFYFALHGSRRHRAACLGAIQCSSAEAGAQATVLALPCSCSMPFSWRRAASYVAQHVFDANDKRKGRFRGNITTF
jgi:hypothetical protein